MRDPKLFGKYAAAVVREGLHSQVAVSLRNTIVTTNLGLVRQVAHRYKKNCSIPYEDLEQVGCLGLIRAVEGYDSLSGNAFSSYAIPWIRGEILHYIRDKTPWFSATRRLMEMKREAATVEQLQEVGRISVCASLDKVIGYASDSVITLGETIADERGQLMQHRRDECSAIEAALRSLSPKHRDIVIGFYCEEVSLAALAQKYGYSGQGTVAMVKFRSLLRLRAAVTGHD